MSAPLGHSKILDGIRGVAVLVVVGHNLGWGWLRSGWYGVDIFFALSGFLITTLLLEEQMKHGSISLRNFFGRRALRLFPALVLLVAVSVLSSFVLRPEATAARVGWVVASVLGYFSNWLVIAASDAWMGGMGHTWSLAVEFQFYVMWALAVYFITRRRGPNLKFLLALAAMIAVASAVWRITGWLGSANVNRPYGGTDTRLDSLFLGAVAALYRLQRLTDPRPQAGAPGGAWLVRGLEIFFVGGVGWLIGATLIRNSALYLVGFAFAGAATAGLILTTLLSPLSMFARPLQNKLLVWFGQLSYSLYLWHLPVGKFVKPERFAKLGLSSWLTEGIRALLCVAVAMASYYGVERTFLRLKDRKQRPLDVASV